MQPLPYCLCHLGVAGVAFRHFHGGVCGGRICDCWRAVWIALAKQSWHIGIFRQACAGAESASVGVRSVPHWRDGHCVSALAGRFLRRLRPIPLACGLEHCGVEGVALLQSQGAMCRGSGRNCGHTVWVVFGVAGHFCPGELVWAIRVLVSSCALSAIVRRIELPTSALGPRLAFSLFFLRQAFAVKALVHSCYGD